jgi:hypothetical protein
MATCDHCGTFILFGGKRLGGLRFCSDACLQKGSYRSAAQQLAQQVPEELVQQQVLAVHQGVCPKCGREGPIDVHVSHRVWSAIHLTSWKSRQHVSCRACAVKAQCGDALFSLLFGWWGFPFGLVLTPVHAARPQSHSAQPATGADGPCRYRPPSGSDSSVGRAGAESQPGGRCVMEQQGTEVVVGRDPCIPKAFCRQPAPSPSCPAVA